MEDQVLRGTIDRIPALAELPRDREFLTGTTTGLSSLTDFVTEHYLCDYIARGGSKMKFVTGRSGSGKTHFLQYMMGKALENGFLTVSFSARDVWLHDFKEIYLEILRQCDIERIMEGCARQIITEMGYDPSQIEEGKNFMDHLSERGEADPISRGEIRGLLRKYFTKNPLLDNNFACCCSLLAGGILGHPVLESSSRELILAFLHGDKTVKLAQLRALGLSPSRITKYNARHLLRSLAQVAHMGGWSGITVFIDDLEILMNRSAGSAMRYTKLRRNDAYESIRQLIDDIDNMQHIMFLFGADRSLMDDENVGMKTYQALWLRIQNEIVSARFNRFADILDLDRYAQEFYSGEVLEEMSRKMAEALEARGIRARALGQEEISELIERARFGGIGLPYLVGHAVTFGMEEA